MKKITFLIVLIFTLSSCAHVEQPRQAPVAVKPLEIQSPVMPQMESTKKIEIEGPKEFFSFSLREADVKDILRAISKQTNYNVVMEPDVKGSCTVDLKNVTLKKALEYILEPLNFVFKIEDQTIYVSKPKIEARVFPLNYIAMRKVGTSTIQGTTGMGRAGTGSGAAAPGVPGAPGGAAGMAVDMRSLTDSDFWSSIEDNIKSLISAEGKYAINKLASTIVVIDYPKNIKNVAVFLEAIEGTTQRQVMIEAKIVEVDLDASSQEGINWSYVGRQWGNISMNVEQALMTPQTKYFNIPYIDDPTKLPTAPDRYFRFGVASGKFDSFIDLLKTQGKVNIVSSPRISTMNNQRAVIKVATEDVYFESTTTQTSGAGSQLSLTPRFITIGLILDVTPQIDNQGNIVMNIHPVMTEKVREVAMPVATGAGGGGTFNTSVPVLAVREVDTLVKVREGESVIIGGLISSKKSITTTGVTGLMDIPGIGGIFKSKEEESRKSELVIFLNPKVVYGKDGT